MHWMHVVAAFLACIGPTLSFAGVNAAWFSECQILGAVAASGALGLAVGTGLAFVPPAVAGGGAALLFALMSERLLAAFVPAVPARIAVMLCAGVLGSVLTSMAGILPLCGIFLVYALFALQDMRKHWKLPKEPLFSADQFHENRVARTELKWTTSLVLKERPNIYVLFLESFHSREALRVLYNVEDDGLGDFLTTCGFTVFKNSLSNACWTQHSMQSLLRMDHYDSHAEGIPEAICHLWGNGYEIQLLDTYMHTFREYLAYADWHNFRIPNWILWLYDHMLPLFMQSGCLMALTGNLDPFTDKTDYAGVRGMVAQRIAKNYTHPQCYIIRFGAHHVDNQYRWTKDSAWPEHYPRCWRSAAADLKDMISLILDHDPKACIAAMGDHGPHMYEDAWREGPDCNTSMLDKGLQPSQVCLDLAGVLMAVRPPDGSSVPMQPLSPCNLFRLLFDLLGAEGFPLTRLPNTTYHHDSRYPRPFILARDGNPLERWEIAGHAEDIAQRMAAFKREPENPNRCLSLGVALEYAGQIEAATTVLQSGLKKSGAVELLGAPLGKVLLRQGRAKEVLDTLTEAFACSHDRELVETVLRAMTIISKNSSGATKVLAQKAAACGMDDDTCQELQAILQEVAGQPAEAEQSWRALTAKQFFRNEHSYQRQINCCRHALCLDALGRGAEGVALLDHLLTDTNWPNHHYGKPLLHAIGLTLRLGDWTDAVRRFQSAFNIMTIPYPETLNLWYAGVLEQTGNHDAALDVLAAATERSAQIPWFGAQLGLFLIRHHNVDARFREFRKLGYMYLREQGKLLDLTFDEKWYIARYGTLMPSGMEEKQHLLHYGRVLGLDPFPYLNTVFYCLTQWDVMQSAYDPFWHSTVCSPFENRDPSLGFHIPMYLAHHRDVDWTRVNPLLHRLGKEKNNHSM